MDAKGWAGEVHGGPGDDQAYEGGSIALFGDSPGPRTDSPLDGDDEIYGEAGKDLLGGFGGLDLLVGGPGGDDDDVREERYRKLVPDFAPTKHPGRDTVRGGRGGDNIVSVDGRRDAIDCGGGHDHAVADEGLDAVADDRGDGALENERGRYPEDTLQRGEVDRSLPPRPHSRAAGRPACFYAVTARTRSGPTRAITLSRTARGWGASGASRRL